MRGPLPLALVVLVAGCGPAPRQAPAGLNEQQAAIVEQRAPQPAKVFTDRWAALFANPAQVLEVANDVGFDVPELAPAKTGGGMIAEGLRQYYPRRKAPLVIASNFAARASGPGQVSEIHFIFRTFRTSQPDPLQEKELLRTPNRALRGFLNRFEISPNEKVLEAMNGYGNAHLTEYGVHQQVTTEKLPGGWGKGNYRVDVVFTPAVAQPQSRARK